MRAVSGYKPGVAMSGGKVIERGYETLREKKMIEKYPYWRWISFSNKQTHVNLFIYLPA